MTKRNRSQTKSRPIVELAAPVLAQIVGGVASASASTIPWPSTYWPT